MIDEPNPDDPLSVLGVTPVDRRDGLAAALEEALDAEHITPLSEASIEALAALADGEIVSSEAGSPIRSAADRLRAEAAVEFLTEARVHQSAPPTHLVDEARRALSAREGQVVRLPPRRALPPLQTYPLLAAASEDDGQAIVWHGEGGHWSLGTYPGMSKADRERQRGTLLLSINPEFAAAYEGLTARVTVMVDGIQRLLAEGVVVDGSLFAHVSFAGLDVRSRNALSVEWLDASDPD